MTRRLFNPRLRLRHIVCFLEVARLGGIAKVAMELHITQPAVTKTIQDLEELLGTALFVRGYRQFTLTDAGKVFLHYALSSVNMLRQGCNILEDIEKNSTIVRVGALPTASSSVLPPAVKEFADQSIRAKLVVVTGLNDYLLSQLRLGDLDFVIGRMADPEKMTGLTFEHLCSERVVLAVRPGHPLLEEPLQFDRIANYRLIIPPVGSIIRQSVEKMFMMHGITKFDDAIQSVSSNFGRGLACASDYVWAISEGVVRHDVEAGTLVLLPVDTTETAGPVGLTKRVDYTPSFAADALMTILRNTVTASTTI
ncbi:pca operon transcription factor PcaQ [Sinorhizobium mexicanum]|nr:pca operon transcription factor PcaQ [Sinorhizobium mexicanum]MBP1884351.1 LysR family pca operon transcriptional activator [Sinorhizobium mexicanum]